MSPEQSREIALWRELRETPELLEEIQRQTGDELRIQHALRSRYPAELVRLGLVLNAVRLKASGKFSRGNQLWLTRRALEQATSEPVAQYKARRFGRLSNPDLLIHDYCCGMGGDAIALARHGRVLASDLDPVVLQLAAWNAEVHGVADRIEFAQADAAASDVTGRIIHIDPDQRDATGRRHLRLEQVHPELTILQEMANNCRAGAIKLSPASNFGGKFPRSEIELVSWRGECKLATVWCGELGEPGLWRATSLPTGETLAGDPLAAWPETTEIQEYLYDPDPAVVRAGLINLLGESLNLSRIDDADEYLTSQRLVASPFVTGFQVEDVLNRNEKQLRHYLRSRNVGIVEIKCRQIPLDVEKLRRSLSPRGEESTTLIYARVAGKTQVVVCRRCDVQAGAPGDSSA